MEPSTGTPTTLPHPRSAEDDGAAPCWSPWAVGTLVATGLLLVGAVVFHIAMVFLSLAPSNAVTTRHREVVNAYVQPEFGQDWRLFAPNPQQRNETVGVRLRTAGAGGTPAVSGWVNVTAEDIETIRGNPAPSHVHQNMLRRAWDGYVNSHSPKERPQRGRLSELSSTYLKRVVLQRIGREWQGRPIVGLQVAGRFTAVPPPSWTTRQTPDTTAYRVLPWWPVTDQDYREL
ncbi:hypothetical protein GCM10010313_55980 [Streptomyces violarus]|uniref:Uncharacterized protein n=1 Tax=Streptomyces violarus TaxID=67380 RepID=A0A7W5F1V1_9ACTN|nr:MULTISPECIES: DUF5819 family protein [Streptomyces]MBB3076743.1 hypothetical protein [Streptomyces violarus]WRU01589.1 DUF5819 family protein [Streptomyces sp. CGMCC 4.1772]GHD21891.1 hypothetical protein GCM10010313_55980 [Streptomyces violarus]